MKLKRHLNVPFHMLITILITVTYYINCICMQAAYDWFQTAIINCNGPNPFSCIQHFSRIYITLLDAQYTSHFLCICTVMVVSPGFSP